MKAATSIVIINGIVASLVFNPIIINVEQISSEKMTRMRLAELPKPKGSGKEVFALE